MAVGINIVSNFDSKGIRKALTEFKKLEGAGNKATFSLRTIDKAVGNGFANVAKYGGIAAAAIGVIGFQLVKGAEASKQADDRLIAVTNSMSLFGGATSDVTQRLIALADAQEFELGVTAETIKATQAKLMTFKNIAKTADETGGAFDRATTAAVDLAAAGFGAAETNAIQLGKALQDPIKGITALARAGVTFTDAEKDKIRAMVESGKMLEAQETLLRAIEVQVGGTAAATVTDSFKIAAAFGHVSDEIGTVLLPVVEKLADFMVSKVVPFATKAGEVFGREGFGGGVQFLLGELHGFIQSGNKVVDIILGIGTALAILKGITIAATISQNLFNVALLSNPIGIVVAALIAVGVAVVAAYVRFEGFRKVVNTVINAIIGYVEFMANTWIRAINIVIGALNKLSTPLRAIGINIPVIGKLGEVSFGRITTASNKAAAAIAQTRSELDEFRHLLPSVSKPNGFEEQEEVATGVGKAVKTLKELMKEYRTSVLGLVDAQKQLSQSSAAIVDAQRNVLDAGDKVAESLRNISKAQNEVTNKTKAHEKAQQSVTRAMADAANAVLATQKAQDKLAGATDKVAAAQRALDEAVRGYGAGSTQGMSAAERLQLSQEDLERAGYDLESAQFKVIDAERTLAETRADGNSTARDIRQAEIDLAEAKLDLISKQRDQAETQTEVTTNLDLYDQALNGVRSDSEIYNDLLDELNSAKDAEREAIDAVTAARERETEATAAITDALIAEQDALNDIEDAKLNVIKAVKDHEKALYDEAQAITKVAEAQFEEAKSLLAVAEAQRAVNAARGAKGLTGAAKGKVDTRLAGVLATASGAVASAGRAMAIGSMPMLASGGIVTRSTAAIVGERGPEAVIPLSSPHAPGLGTTINVTVNAGMGADGDAVGKAVVDALRQYQRHNGAIPITVA